MREMLREFARFSPRGDSPTSRLTVQQVYDELMERERHQQALDGMEGDPMRDDEAAQQMDNADQKVYEGPLTLEQPVNRDIESIRTTRMRMINELRERLAEAEACSNQELIWDLEQQLDLIGGSTECGALCNDSIGWSFQCLSIWNGGFTMVYLQWCLCWLAYLHMYLYSVSGGHICYKHVLRRCKLQLLHMQSILHW